MRVSIVDRILLLGRSAPALRWVMILAGLTLASCSTVNVKVKPGTLTRSGIASAKLLGEASGAALASLGEAGVSLLEGARHLDGGKGRAAAAGQYLRAAIEARETLLSGDAPADPDERRALLALHNDSLARFAEVWNEASKQSGGPLSKVPAQGQQIEIRWADGSTYKKDYFDRLIAAGSVEIKGVQRQVRDGVGASLVAIRYQLPERAEEMEYYAPRGLHVPATLTLDDVAEREGGTTVATMSLRNPMVQQSIRIGSRTFPLAGDFSAAIAVNLAGRNEWIWGLEGFFEADERAKKAGVFMTEPYDPKRIPLLMIHGLVSVPIIWRDIIPRIGVDPELSKRYQMLVFAYPSSYPIVDSAALLRDELAALRAKYDPDGNDPLSKNMLVAGHSMGGILSRSLAVEIGDNLWNEFCEVPIEKLGLPPEEDAALRRLAFFDPDPAVRRLIYYSAPHRGADMAEGGLVGLVSKAVALPGDVLQASTIAFAAKPEPGSPIKVDLNKKVTSVQSLQPGAPMIVALDKSPLRKGVTYHSVIGDRGKGDTPNSSDGVVEYWSSHLDGAASELIVPSGHSSFGDPAGIDEMIRILRLHIGLR